MRRAHIKSIMAHEILDSRGNPTLKTVVYTYDGFRGEASVPSGASTGAHEALELRDHDPSRYHGKGVLLARDHVNIDIAPVLHDLPVFDQRDIDKRMMKLDGTQRKENLGANAILSVSLALAAAAANALSQPLYRYLGGSNAHVLPVPMMNVLNGGKHADNNITCQEFMIMPLGAHSFSQAMQWGVEVYDALKSLLKQRGLSTAVGDEGGFAPDLSGEEEAIETLLAAIDKAGFRAGHDLMLAMDPASTEMYNAGMESGHHGKYFFWKSGVIKTPDEMIDYWKTLCSQYPIISLEDPLAENEWGSWSSLVHEIGHKVQIVGDDLLVTNPDRIGRAIKEKAANSVLIKVNQIGSLSESLDAIQMAQSNGYTAVISHRSGETEDTFIADLAVATNSGQIKTGAPCRTDRVAKYNRLLCIESELGDQAVFAGKNAIHQLKNAME